jgi:hypothetical protein
MSLINDEEMERNFEEFLAEHTTLRPRDLIADQNFDYKSGGEFGNGLFSSRLTEHHNEDSDGESKPIIKIRKSGYQVMNPPKSSLSKNSRMTNRNSKKYTI